MFVPRPERRVGARRDRPPPTPAVDVAAEPAVPARAHGVRAAPQDAAPVAGRASSTPTQFAAAGIAPRRAARGARRRRLGAGSTDAWRRRRDDVDRRAAPAKLTLSLRITGVRDDGYHLIDAEMVTPRPRRHADDRSGRRRADASADRSPPACRSTTEPRRPGAAARRPAAPACTSTSRSPTAAGSAAARPTPPRCCAGPASTTSSPPRGSAPTSRSAWSAAGPACAASARSSSRSPYRAARRHAGHAAAARQHAGGLPGVGRARRADGRRTATTSSRRRSWSSRRSPSGATGSPTLTGVDAGARRQRGDVVRARRSRRRPRRRAAGATVVRTCTDRPRAGRTRPVTELSGDYLRRWWRVRRSIFLCFFLRMRLRRFLISEPIGSGSATGGSE